MTNPRRILVRALVVWVVTAFSIALLSRWLKDFEVNSWQSVVIMAAVFGIFNSIAWPIIIRIALPFTVLTLGFGVLLLNGLVVEFSSQIASEKIYLDSLADAILVALGITLINGLILSALAVEDDEFYHLGVVRRYMKKNGSSVMSKKPGTFFLEIDGLAYDVLQRAMRDGNAPTMAKWLHQGSHKLIQWETDWSSQTGAMQAGILHGNNDDMPAFRWWEKERAAAVVSNRPKDAMEIEKRHSDGKGLLANNGASRANLLSGDAPYSLLTMSTVLRKNRKGRIGQDYYTYFSNPYNLLRTLILVINEVVIELWQAYQQRRLQVEPRVHRGFVYSLLRASTTVIQRDLQVEAVIGDMMAGRPVAYTTFLGYDEVAHHSGIERLDSLVVLRKIDRQFRRIESAIKFAPRPYRLVVLSDHGQTQGATFLQRTGMCLEELIANASSAETTNIGGLGDEGAAVLSASLKEIGNRKGVTASIARSASRSKDKKTDRTPQETSIKVMVSGCLGLVYFTDISGRVNLEDIESLYPNLIPRIVKDPSIGFILVRSKKHGSVVIGKSGKNFLDKNRIEGKDPLESFGENAAKHIKRTSGFKHCADIMINSSYWPMSGEVAAFEELVGSHGGLGGTQNYPFILYPSVFSPPNQSIVGAEKVHILLKKWLFSS